jgi:hypothetical protein
MKAKSKSQCMSYPANRYLRRGMLPAHARHDIRTLLNGSGVHSQDILP